MAAQVRADINLKHVSEKNTQYTHFKDEGLKLPNLVKNKTLELSKGQKKQITGKQCTVLWKTVYCTVLA